MGAQVGRSTRLDGVGWGPRASLRPLAVLCVLGVGCVGQSSVGLWWGD